MSEGAPSPQPPDKPRHISGWIAVVAATLLILWGLVAFITRTRPHDYYFAEPTPAERLALAGKLGSRLGVDGPSTEQLDQRETAILEIVRRVQLFAAKENRLPESLADLGFGPDEEPYHRMLFVSSGTEQWRLYGQGRLVLARGN